MTLISALRIRNTPVLVGDYLVTANQAEFSRKKVLRVADNFAFAWTGSLSAANAVAASLQHALGSGPTTLPAVRDVLTDPDTSDVGELDAVLICWVIDSTGEHCFRWRTDYPSELFFGGPLHDGSGESEAQRFFRIADRPWAQGSAQEVVGGGALTYVSMLMQPEIIGPQRADLSFGFAYDALHFAGGRRFEYIDDVLYVAYECRMSGTGQYEDIRRTGMIHKQEAFGDYAVVQVMNTAIEGSSYKSIVTPIGLGSPQTLEMLKRRCTPNVALPLRAKYYCVYLKFVSPGGASQMMRVYQSEPPVGERWITATRDDTNNNTTPVVSHWFSPEILEHWYRTMCETEE